MYRELIAGLIQGNNWAQLQPPCPDADIERAGKYVGYPFAEGLKALLRETNGDHWLLMSADELMENVKLNREILAEASEDEKELWEKVNRHIFFATNGCGDYYCYRVLPGGEVDTGAIYLWEHETFAHHAVAKDIPDLIGKYYHDEV